MNQVNLEHPCEIKLVITPQAVDYLNKKLEPNNNYSLSIKSGGCAGYSYVLEQKQIKPNYCFNGIWFYIPYEQLEIINNTTIDIKKDGISAQVIFTNSKATHYCGCSKSWV